MTREEAIKMLKSKMDGHTDTSYEWVETVRMAIKALEQVGHWIDCSNGWMCSECRKDNKYDTDYCPNCGARMESEDKEGCK